MPLVVISGLDGCGKTTQINLLKNNLSRQNKEYGKDFIDIKFPRYDYPSAKMVELYLRGEFGSKPDDVPPYLASSFYAIDRALSFIQEPWGKLYCDGKFVVSDRFYESNIIHQTAKDISINSSDMEIRAKIKEFLEFTLKIEHEYFGIPYWDLLIFLTMSPELNWDLLQSREHMNGDIHERDKDYFDRCHRVVQNSKGILPNTEYVSVCDHNNKLRTPSEISNQIFSILYNKGLI